MEKKLFSHPTRFCLTLCAWLLTLAGLPIQAQAPEKDRNIGLGLGPAEVQNPLSQLYEGSYALVIGASDYTNWPVLPGVKEDVPAVSQALRDHGFVVENLTNPTRNDFQNAMEGFIKNHGANFGNRVLIYFTGHGHTITKPDEDKQPVQAGYLVMKDAPLPNRGETTLLDATISMEEIEKYAVQIKSKHALFLLDSCFSGSLLERDSATPPPIVWKNAQKPVRQFITAGAADETVPDRSIFRTYFVKALRGEADLDGDGYILEPELFYFISKGIALRSKRAQNPLHGKIQNKALNKGEFIFVVPRLGKPADARFDWQNRYGMEFIKLSPGAFLMGSDDREEEKPQRQVEISRAFYLGKYEVTQLEWENVLGQGMNRSWFRPSDTSDVAPCPFCPVENVSWNDAQAFLKKLNMLNDSYFYRLPTEAEWEYASRAGATTPFPTGAKLTAVFANFDDKSGEAPLRPVLVGRYQPNQYGLYDMQGNVMEWCEDVWHPNYEGAPVDGSPWLKGGSGNLRVLRGGSWSSTPAANLRSSARTSYEADKRNPRHGLRVVAVVGQFAKLP